MRRLLPALAVLLVACGASLHVESAVVQPAPARARSYALVHREPTDERGGSFREQLRRELHARGWRAAPRDRADVWILGQAKIGERVERDTYSFEGRFVRGERRVERRYQAGRLELRAVERETGATFWQGAVSSDDVRSLGDDELRAAARRVLTDFPPAPQ